ncbi:MAG: spermidine/putrescine ABC transporter substrate-binding protein [bacterium]|nr:spermidine/putrescine ABC transporter substrate-binding protein [bacterium]
MVIKKTAIVVLLFGFISASCAKKDTSGRVVIYNWKDYTNPTIIKDFEKETGIKVTLKEYKTTDMAIAELQTNPGVYDIIVINHEGIMQLVHLKLVHEFDLSKIPGARNNNNRFGVQNSFRSLEKYAIPYLVGTTGFVINTAYIPETTNSLSVLWDKKYKNKITLIDDMTNIVSILRFSCGFSAHTTDPEELKETKKKALLLKQNGVSFGDTFDNLKKVMSGEKWIAQVYNGDVVYKARDKKNIKFIYPREGFIIWQDNFALCTDSKNTEEAHKLVDFFCRPKISARSANTYFYATPIKEAEKYLSKDLKQNPVIYPPQEILSKGEYDTFLGMNKENQRIYELIK